MEDRGFVVYILVSSINGSLYTGQTKDLKERIKKHNAGQVKSTQARKPFSLGYFESFDNRKDAMWREWELKKKWNTERKKRLIAGFDKSKIDGVLGL